MLMTPLQPTDLPPNLRPSANSAAASEAQTITIRERPRSATGPEPCPFGACDGSGFYLLSVRFGHPQFGKLQNCECKYMAENKKSQERAARSLAQFTTELGDELARCTLDNFDPNRAADPKHRQTLAAARDLCRAYVEQPRGWIYLYGPVGVGKSHLLAATGRALGEQGMTAAYATEPELMMYLRAGWGKRSNTGDPYDTGEPETTDERIVHLQNVDVLLIDDLGTEHRGKADQSWCDSQLFSILHPRYRFARPTLFTSNLKAADLEFRLASRIKLQTSIEETGREQLLLLKNTDQREGKHRQ